MTWKEPTQDDICSNDLILWDNDHKELLKRISKILDISSFPSAKRDRIQRISEHDVFDEKAKTIQRSKGIFETDTIDLFKESKDHILFISNHDSISGLTHFTDYNCRTVYECLFSNIFEFEKGLRLFLEKMGESNITFHAYARKNLDRKRKKSNDANLKAADNLFRNSEKGLNGKAFERLSLTDLMNFSVSSINGNTILKEKLIFLKRSPIRIDKDHSYIDSIRELRNQVMHAKGNDGSTTELTHNFTEFQLFFERVQVLKDAFTELSRKIDEELENSRIRKNNWRLKTISDLSDDEIRSYFGF